MLTFLRTRGLVLDELSFARLHAIGHDEAEVVLGSNLLEAHDHLSDHTTLLVVSKV